MTAKTATKGRLKVCSKDGEPLVFTFEFPGAEYVCVTCGALYGVLGVPTAPATAEIQERYAELHDRYEAARAEREGRPAPKPTPQDGPRPSCHGCGDVADGRLDSTGKPPHWYSRTIDGVTQYACSRDCITSGTVAPW